tara:strand:+ start:115 stop:369 length:255 start_codon:yes stop_codon:yes gene_type:complete
MRAWSGILKKHTPLRLGRWNTANAERKSELANHDHCGGPQCSKVEMTKHYDSSMDSAVCALQSFDLYPKEIKPPNAEPFNKYLN